MIKRIIADFVNLTSSRFSLRVLRGYRRSFYTFDTRTHALSRNYVFRNGYRGQIMPNFLGVFVAANVKNDFGRYICTYVRLYLRTSRAIVKFIIYCYVRRDIRFDENRKTLGSVVAMISFNIHRRSLDISDVIILDSRHFGHESVISAAGCD